MGEVSLKIQIVGLSEPKTLKYKVKIFFEKKIFFLWNS